MDTPRIVSDNLDGESVTARVALGGDDAVYVTPNRTLVYRAEGLLSDESVGAYPHDVERLSLSVGRRKAGFEFEYVDGEGEFTVPADRVDAVLRPVLTGVLGTAGVLEEGERVETVHRFKELTLAVTGARVVKHVGGALWDHDFESFPFADVTDVDLEEGSVSDQLVLAVDGRPQRVKIPSEEAPGVYRGIEQAVRSFHAVDSLAELGGDEADAAAGDAADALGDDNIAPLVDRPDDAGGDRSVSDGAAAGDGATGGDAGGASPADGPSGSADRRTGAESETADAQGGRGHGAADAGNGAANAADGDDAAATAEWVSGADLQRGEEILARLEALEEAVDRQTDLIEAQQDTIDRLVEELKRGR